MQAWKVSWVVILALASWGCDRSRSEPVKVRSEGVELSAAAEPAEIRVGRNALWLELRDAAGAPVTGAALDVNVRMHAMGAMAPMGGPAAVSEIGSGRYRADFDLDMGGTWNIEIESRSAEGATARAEGSLTVGTRGLRLVGVGSGGLSHGSSRGEHAAHASSEMRGEERHPGEFQMDPGRVQRVGVRIAPAERKALATTIRAVGRVVAEETTLEDVALKVRGWVADVVVDATGDPVTRGQVLFSVYSPELHAAQEEYLQALRSQERARGTSAPDRVDALVRAARNRLRLWDIAAADLDRLTRTREPLEHLPIRAPVSGYVVEKYVVEGSAFEAGERLYRIAPLSRVWVEAYVYEYELPLVREGQQASVTLPASPDAGFDATVAYVYPTLDPKTRTARIRLEVPNPDLALRPDMYANVRIHAERGERLVVPQSAVLYAGERSFVFRSLGEGRFRPQAVEVGLRSGEEVEILAGLAAGDSIVTSATFLIASESRLRAALEQW